MPNTKSSLLYQQKYAVTMLAFLNLLYFSSCRESQQSDEEIKAIVEATGGQLFYDPVYVSSEPVDLYESSEGLVYIEFGEHTEHSDVTVVKGHESVRVVEFINCKVDYEMLKSCNESHIRGIRFINCTFGDLREITLNHVWYLEFGQSGEHREPVPTLFSKAPSLQSLFVFGYEIDDETMDLLADQINLVGLRISFTNLPANTSKLSNLNKIRHLNLGITDLNDEILRKMLIGLQELQYLNVASTEVTVAALMSSERRVSLATIRIDQHQLGGNNTRRLEQELGARIMVE